MVSFNSSGSSDGSGSGTTLPTSGFNQLNETLEDFISDLGSDIGGIDPSDPMNAMMKMAQLSQQMSIMYVTELNMEKTINTCCMKAANDITFPE